MGRHEQVDLFSTPEAGPVEEWEAPRVTYRPNLDDVRSRLEQIVGEARAARSLPWDARRTRLFRTIVPQMTLWLPDDEAAQWRLDFDQEMARLESSSQG